MKRRTKKETFQILSKEYGDGGLRSKKDREKFGKSLKPSISGGTVRRYLREMEQKGILVIPDGEESFIERVLDSEERYQQLIDEIEKGGLQTKKDREKFGQSLTPPLSGWTVQTYITRMKQKGLFDPSVRKIQFWTKEEDKILTEKSKIYKLDDVRKKYLTHRTLESLRHRSIELNLDLHQYSTSPWNKHWTTKEELKLLDYLELGYTIEEMTNQFSDRTLWSVRTKVNSMGFYPQRYVDEYYERLPWNDEEVHILKKWYPLIGTKTNEYRMIIGTPTIMEKLPRRNNNSINLKSFKLGIKYDPQNEVEIGKRKCTLCLKIKSSNDFYRGGLHPHCKNCYSEIGIYFRTHNRNKVCGGTLKERYETLTGKKIEYDHCVNIIDQVFEKYGEECFFQDEFCDNRWTRGITIGHKISVSRGGSILDVENLFPLCMEHNHFMSDVNLDELKPCIEDMLSKLNDY